MSYKIIRTATLGTSLYTFCEGVLSDLKKKGNEVVAISSPDADFEALREREGVRTIAIPMERRMAPLKDLVALFRLIRVFIKEKPDMVHSMTPKAGLLCMIASWLARVPVRVHTFTGLVFPTAKGMTKRLLMTTDRLTCACATHVIPEGQGVLNDLKNNGITSKPMKVLGYGNVMGVDMKRFSRRPEVMEKAALLQKEDVFTFVFVGRIVGDKGINELVHAFKELLAQDYAKRLRLVLVGRFEDDLDPISSETKQMIESTSEIEAVGQQFGDDLLAWYAAGDCFVFPSYREGFPNTVLEAGALGLPSIVTDINGSREIIIPYEKNHQGATGLIVPSHDTNALQKAMEWMITHDAERNLMAAYARPSIESRFEQHFVRQCLFDFYDEILKEKEIS
jgi:glycosyltransferase involved in cell wall biosynthesis